MKDVPVLAPRHYAYVTKDVRDTSFGTVPGIPAKEESPPAGSDGLQQPPAEPDGLNQPEVAKEHSAVIANQVNKKRKLYRQVTGDEVPWFPHDNDIEVLKELV